MTEAPDTHRSFCRPGALHGPSKRPARNNVTLHILYTNVNQQFNFLAVYAGTTQAEARQVLNKVKASNRYPQASTSQDAGGIGVFNLDRAELQYLRSSLRFAPAYPP